MGNRGKGKKGGKKGSKGKKGAKSSNKWGDEGTAQEDNRRVKKKPCLTQESQDREKRIKLRQLQVTKERKKMERLSQPNHTPVVAETKSGKKRKRKRPMSSTRRNRGASYDGGSSEDGEAINLEGDTEHQLQGGLDAGLASYKKLLSVLTDAGSEMPSLKEDRYLADAVNTRRIQTHGEDDEYCSESSTPEEDMESEDEEVEGDESGSDSEEDEREESTMLDETHSPDDEEEVGESREEEELMLAAKSDLGVKEDDGSPLTDTTENGKAHSNDELHRHFISTHVFPAEEAKVMLSEIWRPSFKPLTVSLRKWKALGFSASASRNVDEAPAPLAPGASLWREFRVLPSLVDEWDTCNHGPPSKLQSLLLPPMAKYRDIIYCGWRDEDAEAIRRSYAIHALNHALTSRHRVLRHTTRLRKATEETKIAAAVSRSKNGTLLKGLSATIDDRVKAGNDQREQPTTRIGIANDDEPDEWQRDQGFTRPKVLILLPFRCLAYELVQIMIELLGPKTAVAKKARFEEEYGPEEEDTDGDGGGDERAERARAVRERKPDNWKALFGEGRNMDDMFTLGMSISPGGGKGKPGEGKGVGVRLYTDFYNSDIVIASPVALHRISVPTAETEDGGTAESSVDSDFLSSIEVCILDRADVFLMQNWAYVPEIAEVINARPTGDRAGRTDFSRVRSLFLHDQGRLFRQTLVFSTHQDPNLNALVSRHCRNYEGTLKVWQPSGDGHICSVALQAKQVFQRVPADSPAAQDDARFEYFVGTVLSQILRAKQSHTAVFIPSYFDYVRVRNHLMKIKASMITVHEYSRATEVARSRARFFRGERDLLLYTGRAHFFNRYRIRGIHHLIFYSLPEYPQFYPEMVNFLEEAESMAAVTCLALFTRYERLSLERIVGEERALHMLRSPKNTFLFC